MEAAKLIDLGPSTQLIDALRQAKDERKLLLLGLPATLHSQPIRSFTPFIIKNGCKRQHSPRIVSVCHYCTVITLSGRLSMLDSAGSLPF